MKKILIKNSDLIDLFIARLLTEKVTIERKISSLSLKEEQDLVILDSYLEKLIILDNKVEKLNNEIEVLN